MNENNIMTIDDFNNIDLENISIKELARSLFNTPAETKARMSLIALSSKNKEVADKITEANEIIDQELILGLDESIKNGYEEKYLSNLKQEVKNHLLWKLDPWETVTDENQKKCINALKKDRYGFDIQKAISDLKKAIKVGCTEEYLSNLSFNDKYNLSWELSLPTSENRARENEECLEVLEKSIKRDNTITSEGHKQKRIVPFISKRGMFPWIKKNK